MGKLDGKVAFITGAARGQGRAHAVRLAEEGADVIAVDVCAQYATVVYPMSRPEDLAETVRLVEAQGRRIVASEADVCDVAALQKAFDEGAAELGGVDIVVANAGIGPGGQTTEDEQWDDVVDVNLKGVWNTLRVSVPTMLTQDRGGSIILTSSTGGLIGTPVVNGGMIAYTAAKHGVVGLTKTVALETAGTGVTCNAICPGWVLTPLVQKQVDALAAAKGLDDARARAELLGAKQPSGAFVTPEQLGALAVFLCSDAAAQMTGAALPMDGAWTAQ